MQNFIDNFCVPSSVYGLLYIRNYQKTEAHNYPVDWGNVGEMLGHSKRKVGTVSHLYSMVYVFLWGKDGTQKNY